MDFSQGSNAPSVPHPQGAKDLPRAAAVVSTK